MGFSEVPFSIFKPILYCPFKALKPFSEVNPGDTLVKE